MPCSDAAQGADEVHTALRQLVDTLWWSLVQVMPAAADPPPPPPPEGEGGGKSTTSPFDAAPQSPANTASCSSPVPC